MLRLDEKPIRIEYRVGRGIELSTPIRRAADTNGDFDVSTAEGNAALDARSRVLLAHLRVCTGRTLKQLHCGHLGQQDIERVEADGWVPGATGHLVFSWVLKLHQSVDQIGAVRLEDSYAAPGIEITNVRIRPPPGKKLLRAGDGRTTGVHTQFGWTASNRPSGPRIVVAEWPPPSRKAQRVVLLGLVALLAWGLWAVWRRRRAPAAG